MPVVGRLFVSVPFVTIRYIGKTLAFFLFFRHTAPTQWPLSRPATVTDERPNPAIGERFANRNS